MVAELIEEGGILPPSLTILPHEWDMLDAEHAAQEFVPAEVRHWLIETDLDRQIKRDKPNDYRLMTAHRLKTEQEYWGWMLLEYQCRQEDLPNLDLSYSIHVAQKNLTLIERAMDRLKNIQANSGSHPSLAPDPYADINYSRVKELISIDSFIERIATAHPVNRSITRYKICCPFPQHDDRSPSMTVYLDSQSCWCFGCGRGGDVIETARHFFQVDNSAASVDLLCKYMGIETPRTERRRPQPSEPGKVAANGPGDRVVSFSAARLARGRRRG